MNRQNIFKKSKWQNDYVIKAAHFFKIKNMFQKIEIDLQLQWQQQLPFWLINLVCSIVFHNLLFHTAAFTFLSSYIDLLSVKYSFIFMVRNLLAFYKCKSNFALLKYCLLFLYWNHLYKPNYHCQLCVYSAKGDPWIRGGGEGFGNGKIYNWSTICILGSEFILV